MNSGKHHTDGMVSLGEAVLLALLGCAIGAVILAVLIWGVDHVVS